MRENAGKMQTRITPNTDTFYALKAVKIMIRTQILLKKKIESNRSLRVEVRIRVRFLLFYFELAPPLLYLYLVHIAEKLLNYV